MKRRHHKGGIMTELLRPRNIEWLTAGQFLKMFNFDSSNIKKAQFLPPRFGRPGFGKIRVEYKMPVLKPQRHGK
jgi:hypothetical protein